MTNPDTYHTKPNSTPLECYSFYGGLFDKSKSSTWVSANTTAAVGLIDPVTTLENNAGNFSYGSDTLELSSNVTNVSTYPWALS